eukprot:6308694-Pyramimonas_sp.AAC.1
MSSTSECLPFDQCCLPTARNNTRELNKFVVYDMICLALLTNVWSVTWSAPPIVPKSQARAVNGLTPQGLRDPNRLAPL